MLELIGNGRPAGDLLSRVVRITLGGVEYALPTLPIAGNKRWKSQLDARLTGLVEAASAGGDDLEAILAALSTQVDDLIELLLSYDTSGVLPPRERLEETVYEDELLAAVQEVWRAANPLVGMAVTAAVVMAGLPDNGSSGRTSSPRRRGAGSPRKSRRS